MQDKLLFVQFMHPGCEHSPDQGNRNHISWNTRKQHKRKFLKNPGKYLENNCSKDSDLVFWGEWEAQSDVIQNFDEIREGYPKYLYQPYYSITHNKKGLQNTDPLVFGNNFHYVFCYQDQFSQLKSLKRGSVILFGSQKSGKFILDTVFVVDKYYELILDNNLSIEKIKSQVSLVYADVTLSQIININNTCNTGSNNNCTKGSVFRLYFGATVENLVDEMFSFFPCLPYKDNMIKGFKRPVIYIPEVINHGKNQGVKFTPSSTSSAKATIQDNYRNWQKVKEQVEAQKLKIGVYTELPQKR
ncbi:hypothetical protein Xen7305DRAFT_00014520 [Xenococcus sp. PCC 7305]|uniref:hypothetical protein n=1 Tax=Xenococcus sp. PCC 7305 TaxID=102125 RepID=UPI0002ACEB82|nr:hypothetical protein [Xenococcus sp. PCC 7305]ELS01747.1 hypothetical protein Xen7305DRAFT_00014520 [Xenococcus sp. PCC 7305]